MKQEKFKKLFRKNIGFVALLLCILSVHAQVVEKVPPDAQPMPPKVICWEPPTPNVLDGVYQIAEQMPQFPQGADSLKRFLAAKVKYPPIALENEMQGKVFVQFVVEPDGRITNAKAIRGIGGGCNEEAVRVVSAMPNWTPGKQNGQAVRVFVIVPVNFKLQ